MCVCARMRQEVLDTLSLFLSLSARVVRRGGRMCLLTSQPVAFLNAIQHVNAAQLQNLSSTTTASTATTATAADGDMSRYWQLERDGRVPVQLGSLMGAVILVLRRSNFAYE